MKRREAERKGLTLAQAKEEFGAQAGTFLYDAVAVAGGFGDPRRDPYLRQTGLDLASLPELEARLQNAVAATNDTERRELLNRRLEQVRQRRTAVARILAEGGKRL